MTLVDERVAVRTWWNLLFVHLTSLANVGRIRRNGIRRGGGRHGAGVYAVPLFLLRRINLKNQSRTFLDGDLSTPISSMDLWRWLFGRSFGERRGRRPVAVLFRLPPRCWPVDVCLAVRPEQATVFLAYISSIRDHTLEVSDEEIASLQDFAAGAPYAFSLFMAKVHNEAALGVLLAKFIATGAKLYWRGDESIEVVIRSSVPASAICRLVSLSQRNVKAKIRREREEHER